MVCSQGLDTAKKCLDAAHRAVRLGNPLVALSKIDKKDFAAVFDGNVRMSAQQRLQYTQEAFVVWPWFRGRTHGCGEGLQGYGRIAVEYYRFRSVVHFPSYTPSSRSRSGDHFRVEEYSPPLVVPISLAPVVQRYMVC